jgi:uncharacterized protein YabE (DUF348 family)
MRRKLARAALIGSLAFATLAFGALDKVVTLRIEGASKTMHTYALTVGDVLRRSGVTVGPADWVSPPLGARLREGTQIEIRRAKQIQILMNGRPRQVVTTALTVDQVLADLRVRQGLRDFVSASRAQRVHGGMTLVYRQAVALRVRHDGQTDDVITNAPDVGTVVRELGITMSKRDLLVPAARTYPKAGATIVVKRVGDHVEKVHESIDYPTVYRRTLNMEYGTTRTLTPGRYGIKEIRYLSTYVDGVRTRRKLIKTEVVRDPTPRLVALGAGFPGCTCRRGKQSGEASWYGAEGLTAAHPWLPFGTVVRVENLANGAWVNVVIRDRGPYKNGRIIDLSDNAFARIAPLGQGVADVVIRW